VDYRTFVEHVMTRTGLARPQAEQAIDVTLEILGLRLGQREKDDLAAQLPRELKVPLLRRPDTDLFPADEFYDRVQQRAVIGYDEAIAWSRAVMSVLREAVTPQEIAGVMEVLPPEFGQLFGFGAQGSGQPRAL
jgi:uncharacterized protein (DUF2267 family)